MVTSNYRKANEIADLLDFFDGITNTDNDRKAVASLRADLPEQERIDGKPADPKEQRRGFAGRPDTNSPEANFLIEAGREKEKAQREIDSLK